MELRSLLAKAQQQLSAALDLPPDEARIEAQALMRQALGGVARAWLLAHATDAVPGDRQAAFRTLLARRLGGEPVAYILGRREFYGLDFVVTPDVLIPRPDTETLVEAALRRIPQSRPWRVLDLGAGSGALAVALARHRPQATVTAVDRSAAALAVARRNAEALAAANVRLLQSDWFAALGGQVFEVIVSNPPYIAAADPHLRQGDLRFEPADALAGGVDGLDDIRRIVAEAPRYLTHGGWLVLEHGYDQAAQVAALFAAAQFGEIGHAADLAGIQRVTLGRKP